MPANDDRPELFLRFHGRILDSLGIQMYQSPVAAVAELIANAWDADAEQVEVSLPTNLAEHATLTVSDNGVGMSHEECQAFYLNVGRNRRSDTGDRSPAGRPVLGRKGIGKFAGFGIADLMRVETTSQATGERTVFELDIRHLRSDDYVDLTPKSVAVVEYAAPNEERKNQHGTKIHLTSLKFSSVRHPEPFARSMARRFNLAAQAHNFTVTINGHNLPNDVEPFQVQYDFPNDYTAAERPEGLVIVDGWGIEEVAEGQIIRWRVRFSDMPITNEEFRGISIFCGVKVAQNPFFFHLSGGLGGQHGLQYLTGKVSADYLDNLRNDIITTERQRINWEDPAAINLLGWGQDRVRSLLNHWKERRAQERVERLDARVEPFSVRLGRLPSTERRVVKAALTRIAQVEALDGDQFSTLAEAILTAWEGGRLQALINDISRMDGLEEGTLLSLLAEAQVIGALHMAEVIRTRIGIIAGLERRISERDLENAVRDYIAENPWLIGPEWDTFRKEISLNVFVQDALAEAGIDRDPEWQGRMDLVLRSANHLLVLEFMRPGLTIDRNHINRFRHYVQVLQPRVNANSALGIDRITGLLVADRLNKKPDILLEVESMSRSQMHCLEWSSLLARAKSQWQEFMFAVAERAPHDARISALRTNSPAEGASVITASEPEAAGIPDESSDRT